ncbi:MAG: PTS sugar transporter subunit IIA [Defluviitaleaceae bacterium]|nr:PTS sugar transporter subunit IIA [Defluviitaleaceae bacterium]
MGEIIRKQGLLIDNEKRNWEEAIRICGDLMVSLGSVTGEYTDAMVDAINKLGPYIVIAPHIAFAHAQAGTHVLKNDLVLVVFKEPVVFNCGNDPVHLMFGICAVAPDSHLEILQKLVEIIDGDKAYEEIRSCNTTEELYKLINK